jgi:hypothetical protein
MSDRKTPVHIQGIPIIGAKHMFLCPRGHVDELADAFKMVLPEPDGGVLQIPCCRLCMIDWLTWTMPVRQASDEERAMIQEARKRDGNGATHD